MDDSLEEIDDDLDEDNASNTRENLSRRSFVIRRLLNDLLNENEWETTKKCYTFTPLEAIIEEPTPCSSSQQLYNNFSINKNKIDQTTDDHNTLKFFDIETSDDDDKTTSDDELFTDANALQNLANNLSIIKNRITETKSPVKIEEYYSGDNSPIVGKSRNSYNNDSNTSNIDIRNDELHNCSDSCESRRNKRKCIAIRMTTNSNSVADDTSTRKVTNITENATETTSQNIDDSNDESTFKYVDPQEIRKQIDDLNHKFDELMRKRQVDVLQYENFCNQLSELKNQLTSSSESEPYTPKNRKNHFNKLCTTSKAMKNRKRGINTLTVKQNSEVLSNDVPVAIDQHQSEEMANLSIANHITQELQSSSAACDSGASNLHNENQVNTQSTIFNLNQGDHKLMDNCANTIDSTKTIQLGHRASSIDSIQRLCQLKDRKSNRTNNYIHTQNERVYTQTTKPKADKFCNSPQSSNKFKKFDTEVSSSVSCQSSMREIAVQVSDQEWIKICNSKTQFVPIPTLNFASISSTNSEDENSIGKMDVDNKSKVIFEKNKFVSDTENKSGSSYTIFRNTVADSAKTVDTKSAATSPRHVSCFQKCLANICPCIYNRRFPKK